MTTGFLWFDYDEEGKFKARIGAGHLGIPVENQKSAKNQILYTLQRLSSLPWWYELD